MFKMYNHKTVTRYSLKKWATRMKTYMCVNYCGQWKNNIKLERDIWNESRSTDVFLKSVPGIFFVVYVLIWLLNSGRDYIFSTEFGITRTTNEVFH